MGTSIFYTFGIIIPTLVILYTFGHFAYKLGDYYENNANFPKFILLLIFDLFLLTIVLLDDYHVLIMFDSTDAVITTHHSLIVSIFCWNFLIIYDCIMMNKFIDRIDNIDEYIIKQKPMIFKYRYVYIAKLFVIFGLLISLLIGLFSNTFNLFTWLILLYIYNSWNINNYLKKYYC